MKRIIWQKCAGRACVSLLLILTIGVLAFGNAEAKSAFPSKTITFVLPVSPGGGFDTVSRMIIPYLQKYLPGKPKIIIKNAPGGEWNIGIVNVLDYVDIFLPNEIEALNISQTDSKDDALDILLQKANTVVIKCGLMKINYGDDIKILSPELVVALGLPDQIDVRDDLAVLEFYIVGKKRRTREKQ